MSQNLTMSPDLGKEDWDPDVITRMIFIGPGAHVSEQEIVSEFHMLGLPLTIKNTCYGSMISGKSEDVYYYMNTTHALIYGEGYMNDYATSTTEPTPETTKRSTN